RRPDPPHGVQAPAQRRPLRARDCARDGSDPPGGLPAPAIAQGGRAGRGSRRRNTASLRGRYPRHRRGAPLARWGLGCHACRVQEGGRARSSQGKEIVMTEPTTSRAPDPNSVWKVVSVQAPPDVAWQVFTEQMGTWWPLAVYKIGKAKAVDAVIEPRVGGR